MKKMAYFDMDGTIANFYGVDGWLDCLTAHDPRPYAVAEPLFTAEQFAKIVQILQAQGFGIGIISWWPFYFNILLRFPQRMSPWTISVRWSL